MKIIIQEIVLRVQRNDEPEPANASDRFRRREWPDKYK